MCIHGGGFVSGSIYTHRKMFGHLAKAAGARALLVDYRLLPEGGVSPVPVDEVEAAYRWLLAQGTAAGHVAFAGDSVGGWLAVTVQLRAREQGLPLPAAAMLLSPAVDMEASGNSFATNRDKDPLFGRYLMRGLMRSFLGEAGDPSDPLVNPLHADLTGLGRSISRWVETRRCWMTPACWTSMPGRPALMCGLTSSLGCCTPSRWQQAVLRRPTTRSAGWLTGYGRGWIYESQSPFRRQAILKGC